MRHSTDRILVSHAGNLPRPDSLNQLIDGGSNTSQASTAEYHRRLPAAVQGVVDRQIELGIDVVNDGEYVKAGSYGGYVQSRLSGWETRPFDPKRGPKRGMAGGRDLLLHPGVYEAGLWTQAAGGPFRPGFKRAPAPLVPANSRVVTGPVKYVGQAAIEEDIANMKAAIAGKDVEGFISALGPLSTGAGSWQEYYTGESEYMTAVADALHEEYKAITDAGLILQIDEPEFCTTWQFYADWTLEDLRRYLANAVDVINHAIRGLPEELIRFHVCWASPRRPHTQDIELKYIADLLIKIRAQSYSVEAAGVRHAHEWKVWKDVKLPDGKILMPGIVTHMTDLVEHPEQVAERLIDFAGVVGKENLQTGTDCGIGSRVGHEEIAWAKLRAMSEGARIASERLWGR